MPSIPIKRSSSVTTEDSARVSYSYDAHGNVEWVAQQTPGFPQTNYVHYTYDLLSGNVRRVTYNDGRADQFHQRYVYDGENRLVGVESSGDGRIWESDARYRIDGQGRLRRRELGEDSLAGLDYTYTGQGALKGINGAGLDQDEDPGGDGATNSFAPDSFGLVLEYHRGDYARGGSSLDSSRPTRLRGRPLYDRKIGAMASRIGAGDTTAVHPGLTGETYGYDQLGRLARSDFARYVDSTQTWETTEEYATGYGYDPNGNLDSLRRNAEDVGGSLGMDSLRYHYTSGRNRLDHVDDGVSGAPRGTDMASGQSAGNYGYDGSGNLVSDAQEGLTIAWTGAGRPERIRKTGAGAMEIRYLYDAFGNLVRRSTITGPPASPTVRSSWYVYEATGKVVAIYAGECADTSFSECAMASVEYPIYGIGREGVVRPKDFSLTASGNDTVFARRLDERRYQITDHLGNVRVVIGDVKLSDTSGGTPHAFRWDVRAYANLYPYGMEHPGRSAGGGYRYGYNGMERDSGVAVETYRTYYREYDARLGRWWGIDPVTNAGASPYVAMAGNPILASDASGADTVGQPLFGEGPPRDGPYSFETGQIYTDTKTSRRYAWLRGEGWIQMTGPTTIVVVGNAMPVDGEGFHSGMSVGGVLGVRSSGYAGMGLAGAGVIPDVPLNLGQEARIESWERTPSQSVWHGIDAGIGWLEGHVPPMTGIWGGVIPGLRAGYGMLDDVYVSATSYAGGYGSRLDGRGAFADEVVEARVRTLGHGILLGGVGRLSRASATFRPGAGGGAHQVGRFRLTETVARHATDLVKSGRFKGERVRPFLNSPNTIEQIIATGKGVPDPGGEVGALRFDVPGTFRGTQGTWELVIKNDLILHFNFVR